ncbi:hypothetical protein PSCICO_12760 [Pseudomonas cichorii]|uniref:hypothetical protein n=1 Tax=Pseudomonas cichorii TaxID=36746 RepID=UPI0019107862|nr:hypothetical protein [Pseudomonas cichorii]GFM85877.1 hypothetical protein PSCICO_12760 [Pseudomonas cichorii]
MAKYRVEQFSSAIKNNGRGYENLFILCKLVNSVGNPALREYRIAPDERHANLNELSQLITLGFNQAKATGKSVEISEFKERMYLYLTMPDVNDGQPIQVTGERV